LLEKKKGLMAVIEAFRGEFPAGSRENL